MAAPAPGYGITKRTAHRPDQPPLPPAYRLKDDDWDLIERIARLDEGLRQLRLDDAEARRLLRETLTRNAYGTASIEGNPLTLDDVRSLLVRGPTPEALVVPDEREILNQYAFMERLDDHTLPRDTDDVRAVHEALMQGVLDDAGSFKTEHNFIGSRATGEVIFVPATPEQVVPQLQAALDWIHDADEPALVRAAVFFHEFQGVHPFRDGNGRTGRAINTIILNRLGYPGIRFAPLDYGFNDDRAGYYESLGIVERNGYEFSPWIRYYLRRVHASLEWGRTRHDIARSLPAGLGDDQVRVGLFFAAQSRERADRWLKFHDVHAAHPEIAGRTLRRRLVGLVDAGILERDGVGKGTRYRFRAASDEARS